MPRPEEGKPAFTRGESDAASVMRPPAAPRDSARPGGSHLSIHPTNIHPALHELRRDPRVRDKDLALTLSAVDRVLKQQNIPHRFGGSLAAAMNGARRSPGDLDVEVANGVHAQAALQVLSQLDTPVKMGKDTVHIKGRMGESYGDFGGKVTLTLTHPSGKKVRTDVDVINENDPRMVGNLHSPHSLGVQIDPRHPNIVPPIDLIVNYLDRLVNRPDYARSKEDPKQIADLLNAGGFDPTNPQEVERLIGAVTAHVQKGNEQAYVQELHSVIRWMTSKALNGGVPA